MIKYNWLVPVAQWIEQSRPKGKIGGSTPLGDAYYYLSWDSRDYIPVRFDFIIILYMSRSVQNMTYPVISC